MDPILQELFKYGLAVGILGIAVYALWNKTKDGDKALIDFLSNKSTDMTVALNNSANGSQASAKATEAMAGEIKALRDDMKDWQNAILNAIKDTK